MGIYSRLRRREESCCIEYNVTYGGVIMSEKIITITREFGSGGRTIGKKVAQKLGIPCYDEELLEKDG